MSIPESSLIPSGQFGFVSLLDAQRSAIELECLVLEVTAEGGTAVVGTPGSALLTESGEWVEVTAEAISERSGGESGPQLTVSGWDHPIVLKRVSHQAISATLVGQNPVRKFVTGEMVAARPPVRGTMAAYFRQDEAVSASETDAGVALRLEVQRLRAALLAAQSQAQPSARSGSSRYAPPSALPAAVHIGDESNEEDGDASEEEDLFGGLMGVPMRPHSQLRPKSRAAAQRSRPVGAPAAASPALAPRPTTRRPCR